jgi:hypothetical protein
MTFLRELLAARPVRTPLEFGINENVKLTAVNNEEHKYDGETIARNTWMTFTKFNKEGNAIASSEFAYYNLKHDSDYVIENFATQAGQLQNIASLLNPDAVIDPTEGYSSMEELKEDLESKKGARALQDKLYELFEEAIDGLYGLKSPFIRLKVIVDKNGKYIQLPKDQIIAESMEVEASNSVLSISAYEAKLKERGLTNNQIEKADDKGSAPGEKVKKKSALRNL